MDRKMRLMKGQSINYHQNSLIEKDIVTELKMKVQEIIVPINKNEYSSHFFQSPTMILPASTWGK